MFNRVEQQSVAILASVFALRMLGLFMIIPVFALTGQQYTGATPMLIGCTIAVYGLMQALLQIPISMYSDHSSRKRLIIIGLLLFCLGNVISGYSTHIYGVLAGRALAGMGAISAVAMALLSDLVREQTRAAAMATMGLSIAMAFNVAFSLGPWLGHHWGNSGMFYTTAVLGALSMVLVMLLPTAKRHIPLAVGSWKQLLVASLQQPQVNLLNWSVFSIHALLSALFIWIPSYLFAQLHIPLASHGAIYLMVMLTGFVLALFAIVLAERFRRMRRVFILAAYMLCATMVLLAFVATPSKWLLLALLTVFFVAFNVLEALLPSWLAKIAPIRLKNTTMGIFSSAQFLGAACGALVAGAFASSSYFLTLLALFALAWVLGLWLLKPPPYYSSISLQLSQGADYNALSTKLLALPGVVDVIVIGEHQLAYLKIDKTYITEHTRQTLSQLSNTPLAF